MASQVNEALDEFKSVSANADNIASQMSEVVELLSAKGHAPLKTTKSILEPLGSPEDKYKTLNRNRVPETATWILPAVKAWMGREDPVLWISGNPGVGKSYIASSIIDYLICEFRLDADPLSHTSVGFFFFKDDDPHTRSFHQTLRDVAYLICEQNHAYAKHVTSCCDTAADISSMPKVWQKLFLDFFGDKKVADRKLYVVLDGLDEAYEFDRISFMGLARDLRQHGNIRLIMLSRPQLFCEITEHMEMPNVTTVHVTEATNSADIVRYVENSLSKFMYLRNAEEVLREEIVQALLNRAHGMVSGPNEFLSRFLTNITVQMGGTDAQIYLHQNERRINPESPPGGTRRPQ